MRNKNTQFIRIEINPSSIGSHTSPSKVLKLKGLKKDINHDYHPRKGCSSERPIIQLSSRVPF